MKKYLFFALALACCALAFTSCKKDKNAPEEPELKGTVYHYHGTSSTRDFDYEHDLYIALEDNYNMTMKWVGVKATEDAEPVTLYMYNGQWESDDDTGFHIHCEAKPQLPDGTPFDAWDTFDVDGWCDPQTCSFDYHINGVTMAIFDGQIVE